MQKSEAVGFITEQLEVFNRSIHGDLKLVVDKPGFLPPDPGHKRGRHLIHEVFKDKGLRGEFLGYTAESRSNLIGLPVNSISQEATFGYAVGLYLPSSEDAPPQQGVEQSPNATFSEIARRVQDATTTVYKEAKRKNHKVYLLMEGDIVPVNSALIQQWHERGIHPTIAPQRESSFSAEDKAGMSRRNNDLFGQHVQLAINQLPKLSAAGRLPRDLITEGAPIQRVGEAIVVWVQKFVNVDSYQDLRAIISERDHNTCQALNMAILGKMSPTEALSIENPPVCGEGTVNNYRAGVGPFYRKIEPGRNNGELNHISPRGDTAKVVAEAIQLGVIPEEVYGEPDKLLEFLSLVNLRSIVADRMPELAAMPLTELVPNFAIGLQYAIEAVNSAGNLANVSQICHRGDETGGYHYDMRNEAWVRFIAALDRGDDWIPLEQSAFEQWAANRSQLVIENQFDQLPPLRENDDPIRKISEGRALVSVLGGGSYVDPLAQRIWSRMVRKKTRQYTEEKASAGAAQAWNELNEKAGLTGVGMEGVEEVWEYLQTVDQARESAVKQMSVPSTGITANKTLQKMGFPKLRGRHLPESEELEHGKKKKCTLFLPMPEKNSCGNWLQRRNNNPVRILGGVTPAD